MSAVFMGEYLHTLDPKGRVILPARYRTHLEGGLVFAPGQDHCIEVYTASEFDRRVETLTEVTREDPRNRAVLRVFLAGAHSDTPDSQGRVTVPPSLRTYARLTRDLTIIGNGERLEIWDRELWDEYRTGAEEQLAGLDSPLLR